MPFSPAPSVIVAMGSDSDLPVLEGCLELLERLQIPYAARAVSAHRTPARAAAMAEGAREAGVKVIICAAGMSAHLAGVVAAHTTLPVIGVPITSDSFAGLDALLSTVNMPPGIPVATVGPGKAGARNAALLAASILSLGDDALARRLAAFRAEQTAKVEAADKGLEAKLAALRSAAT